MLNDFFLEASKVRDLSLCEANGEYISETEMGFSKNPKSYP